MTDDAKSPKLDDGQLDLVTRTTLAQYGRTAESFRAGTWDHDVTQNYDALISALQGEGPFTVLDLGCGPGRDLLYFKSQGIEAVGLDGTRQFVEMARAETGCEVLHQNFLKMDLPPERFDGVFANASLFHVPSQELPRVLRELHATLKPGGVLFCSNPRGRDEEGFSGERYGCRHEDDTWCAIVTDAGYDLVRRYYRPDGLPRAQQAWMATVWCKKGA